MWPLFKETAKGIFYTTFSVSVLFFSIKQITEKDHDWYIKLFWIFGMLMFFCTSFVFAYYTILLPSKLKEGYSSLNEIMNEAYVFKNKYFIYKIFIFERRIYLDNLEKVILDYYEDGDEDGDIFFHLLIRYSGKKIFIPSGSVGNFLKYFSENLNGFDSSILKDETIDDSKIKMLPIALYEKSKLI